MESLGSYLRAGREAKGSSVRQFAILLGKSPSWVSKVERDLERPSCETLMEWLEYLNLPPIAALELFGELPPEFVKVFSENLGIYYRLFCRLAALSKYDIADNVQSPDETFESLVTMYSDQIDSNYKLPISDFNPLNLDVG